MCKDKMSLLSLTWVLLQIIDQRKKTECRNACTTSNSIFHFDLSLIKEARADTLRIQLETRQNIKNGNQKPDATRGRRPGTRNEKPEPGDQIPKEPWSNEKSAKKENNNKSINLHNPPDAKTKF